MTHLVLGLQGFWVYIGAHTLKWAQLHDIWKTLEAVGLVVDFEQGTDC